MEVTVQRPQALWFLDNLVRVHVSAEDSDGRAGVVEFGGRSGDMPPLHLHRDEDEVFHVLDGEFSVFVGDRQRRLTAGESHFAPRSVPHTYRVESEEAHWLVFMNGGRLASFVRAVSRPAETAKLPPSGSPTPEQAAKLARVAGKHGIQLLGPPGMLPAEL